MEELFPRVFWLMVADKQKCGQRYGQAVFNTAFYFWPTPTNMLNGTIWDPFYSEEVVPEFLERLADILTR